MFHCGNIVFDYRYCSIPPGWYCRICKTGTIICIFLKSPKFCIPKHIYLKGFGQGIVVCWIEPVLPKDKRFMVRQEVGVRI